LCVPTPLGGLDVLQIVVSCQAKPMSMPSGQLVARRMGGGHMGEVAVLVGDGGGADLQVIACNGISHGPPI
jgi:hypothetical protein